MPFVVLCQLMESHQPGQRAGPEKGGDDPHHSPMTAEDSGCRTEALWGSRVGGCRGSSPPWLCRSRRDFLEPTPQLTTDLAPSRNIDFFFFHNSLKKSPSPEL